MELQQEVPRTDGPELSLAHPRAGGAFSRLASNAGSNLARQISAMIVVLLLPPMLIRTLSKPGYTTWLLVLQISSYVTLVDNGIQVVIARYVALEDKRTGITGVARVISNAVLLLLALSVAAVLLTLGASAALPHLVHTDSRVLMAEARRALVVIAISYAVALPFSAWSGLLLGYQRSGILAIAGTVGKLLGAAGTAWAALHRMGLVWMAVATGVGTLIQPLIYLGARKRLPSHRYLDRRLLHRPLIVDLVGFSSTMMLSQLTALLISGIDLPIVSVFDFAHAAYYGVALMASGLLLVPFAAITGAFLPAAASLHGDRDPGRLGEMTLRATKYSNTILCLLTFGLMLSIPPLLPLWVRPDYAVQAVPLAEILLVAQFIRLTCSAYAIAGFSAGLQRRMMLSPAGEGLVNLIASVLLAKWLGARGVAYGTLIGALFGVVLHLGFNVGRTRDILPMDRSAFFWNGLVRPTVWTLPGLAIFVVSSHSMRGPFASLTLTFGCFCLTLACLFRLGLSAEDRAWMLHRIHSMVSGGRSRERRVASL